MEDIGDDKGYDFVLGESAAARVDKDDLLDLYEGTWRRPPLHLILLALAKACEALNWTLN